MQRSLYLLALALFAAPAAAGVLSVPGDAPTLAAALSLAAPGDTILLNAGTWGPVTIASPVTIVGIGSPTLLGGGTLSDYEPPVRLAGSGAGTVRLIGLTVNGFVDGTQYITSSAGIEGTGFEALEIHDCTIDGPGWISLSTLGPGQSAVDVDLPFVVIERTTALASASLANGPIDVALPGAPSIETTGALLLLDSIVRGGTAGPYTHALTACAAACPAAPGGNGVICDDLYLGTSQIAAGFGAQWSDPSGQFCCSSADGVRVRSLTETDLGSQLTGVGRPRLGGAFVVAWTIGVPIGALYFGFGVEPPQMIANSLTFMDPTNAVFLFGVSNNGSQAFLLPAGATGLLGLPFVFQVRFPNGDVTRPIGGVVYQ